MKRVLPHNNYKGLPCSVVSVGCAIGATDKASISALKSPFTQADGYLSLRRMDSMVREHLEVEKVEYYRRGERPELRDFAHSHIGKKAIICLMGHFVYFDGKDYHSFFRNGGDPVVQVWYIKEVRG